jgi:hypothetical protein
MSVEGAQICVEPVAEAVAQYRHETIAARANMQ